MPKTPDFLKDLAEKLKNTPDHQTYREWLADWKQRLNDAEKVGRGQ